MAHRTLRALLLLALAACNGDDKDTAGDPTGETADETEVKDVCAAACAKFGDCYEPNPECASDCEAVIEFVDMNNPGLGCGEIETNRQDCLSQLTCEQLEDYLGNDPDDPARPCKQESEALSMCAIE